MPYLTHIDVVEAGLEVLEVGQQSILQDLGFSPIQDLKYISQGGEDQVGHRRVPQIHEQQDLDHRR